jgi:hypothetical protein
MTCKTTYPDGSKDQLHALITLTLAKQLLVTTLTNTQDNHVTFTCTFMYLYTVYVTVI